MPYVPNVKFKISGGVFVGLESPNAVLFTTRYDAIHNTGKDSERLVLCAIHDVIIGCMRTIDEALTSKVDRVIKFKHMFSQNKSIWLLYKDYTVNKINFANKLADFIISKHDVSLSPADYALLYAASCADEDIKLTLESIPLSMLYDIYESFIETEIDEQFRKVIV
jgi:hypothetical protein